MLTSLGVAGLLGILGTFAAVIWTALVGAGGAPGAAIAGLGVRYDKPGVVALGTVLAFAAEIYLLLAFAALTVRVVVALDAAYPAAPGWPLSLVGWYLATAPVLFAGRDPAGPLARNAADRAAALALPLVGAAYWLFLFLPSILDAGWGWVPRFTDR